MKSLKYILYTSLIGSTCNSAWAYRYQIRYKPGNIFGITPDHPNWSTAQPRSVAVAVSGALYGPLVPIYAGTEIIQAICLIPLLMYTSMNVPVAFKSDKLKN